MSLNLPNLPDGWVQQYDTRTDHPFWVDTTANPPRSIWVHPYEDERFLAEHPDIRDRLAAVRNQGPPSEMPPPYSPRRHSFSEGSRPQSSSHLGVANVGGRTTSQPPTPPPGAEKANHHRGFFGKVKDKAIGTKEEREARKQREAQREAQRAAMLQQLAEQRRQQRTYPQYGYGNTGYPQTTYGPPAGDPFLTSRGRYGSGGRFGGGGFGGGGMALPLLGGLAGGLLLGDVLGDVGGGWGGGWSGDPGWGGGGWDNGFGGGGFF